MNLLDIAAGMPLAILNEANVLNIKQPYNGMSIAEYVKDYAKNLATPPVKTIFAKKLSKLLVNDERFLSAVRELPGDAPEWAQQAMASGELVAFVPTGNLNQKIEHLVHYMAALESDSNANVQNNAAAQNTAVIAKRELDAFTKAENLDILIAKSDEYFKRGSKKNTDGTEGMTVLFDAGEGFIWYKLDTIEAFKKEGKTLQNCIGSFYTPERAKADGQTVIILRKGNNESVIAARIKNDTKEIIEMKGKNNKPPVARYIAPVSRFMSKFKLAPSPGARRDFVNAGYHFIEGTLYTRNEVIEKFIDSRPVGEVAPGKNVSVTDFSGASKLDIALAVYPNFFSTTYNGELSDAIVKKSKQYSIYSLSDNGRIAVSALIVDGLFYKIDRHSGLNESTEEPTKHSTHNVNVQLLGNYMWSKNIFSRMAPTITKQLLWADRLVLTDDKGFIPFEIDSTRKHADNDWEEHTDPTRVRNIDQAVRDGDDDISARARSNGDAKITPVGGDAEKIFMTTLVHGRGADHDSVGQLVVMKKNGFAVPHFVNARGDSTTQQIGASYSNYQDRYVDLKIAKSMVALANHEKLDLPPGYTAGSGIYKDEDGKWKTYKPEFKTTSSDVPRATKADLSDIPPSGRLAVIKSIDSISGTRVRTDKDGDIIPARVDDHGRNVANGGDFQFNRTISKALTGSAKTSYWQYSADVDAAADWGNATGETILKNRFKALPDAVHLVEVPYGPSNSRSQEIMLVTSGNKVVGIDNSSLTHQFQSWDDFEKVSQTLNTWAASNNMTFARTAIVSKGKNQNELRISDGQVSTATNAQKAKIDKQTAKGEIGSEGADNIPFADGHKIVRMTPDEQTTWTRKILKTDPTGQGWALRDREGKTQAIAMVQKGRIDKMFQIDQQRLGRMKVGGKHSYTQADIDGVMPTEAGMPGEEMGYWKAAMNAFDWGVKPTAQFMIKPGSKQHKILRAVDSLRAAPRTRVLQRAGTAARSAAGWDSPGALDRHLANFGLLRMTRSGSSKMLRMTPQGIRAMTDLNNGDEYNLFSQKPPKETDEGFSKPAKKEPPAPAPRAPRPAGPAGERTPRTPMAGGEKKSVRAMRWYTEFAQENERLPTRGETMTVLQAEPYNMSKAGASTYAHNIKKKYASLNETYSVLASLELMLEEHQTHTGQVL